MALSFDVSMPFDFSTPFDSTLSPSGITGKVEIAFVANPFDTASLVWTDVTSRVSKFKTASGRNFETDHNEASTITATLRNNDGALNPLNTTSPYHPYVLPFRPIRITATAGGTTYPVWYGYVQSWPQTVKDAASGYNVVEITGVDAFKAVLGFVPGDPYDVKVRKDYGVYTGGAGASAAWNLFPFDEAAAPFAGENGGSLTVMSGATGPAKISPAPCRTGLVFAGNGGLYSSTSIGVQGELWINPTTLPSTPGKGQVVASASFISSATVALNNLFLTGIPSQVQVGYDVTGAGSSLASRRPGIFLLKPYQNLMPTDDSSNFETSVSAWASESGNVTIARSTVNPAEGAANMRMTLSAAAGGAVSLTPRISVTAGNYYGASLAWTGTTYAALAMAFRWYDASGALLSTTNLPSGTVTTAGTYQTLNTAGGYQAPAGAATVQLVLTPSLASGTTGTVDVDAISVYGATSSAGCPQLHCAYFKPSAGNAPLLVVQTGGTATTLDTFVVAAPVAGSWHHIAWASRYNTGAASVCCLDGVAYAAAATGASANGAPNGFQYFGAAGFNGAYNSAGFQYVGQMAGLYVAPVATGVVNVTQPGAQQHYNYGTTAAGAARTHDFPAELTSQRVLDVLISVGIPASMMSVETGLTTMSASGNVSGVAATTLLEQAADTELGNVFVNAAGTVVFHNRNHRNSPTPVATFGENTAGGEIPYEADVEIDFDDTYIYNDIQVTQAGSSPTYMFEAQDIVSQDTYGIGTLQTTVECASQADIQGMAQSLLARYKDPHPRLVTLSTELRSKPSFFPAVLARGIGDCVTVNRRPVGGAPAYSLNVFIDGITHEVDSDAETWKVTFSTTPVYPNTTY